MAGYIGPGHGWLYQIRPWSVVSDQPRSIVLGHAMQQWLRARSSPQRNPSPSRSSGPARRRKRLPARGRAPTRQGKPAAVGPATGSGEGAVTGP